MKRNEPVFPDTNVVLRYLLRDNPEQFATAETFFEEVRSGGKLAVILESVIVECMYVLTRYYNVPRGEVASSLSGLLRYKGIENDDAERLVEALKLFADSRLDPFDCILAALGCRGEGEIFSFDKELRSFTHRKK